MTPRGTVNRRTILRTASAVFGGTTFVGQAAGSSNTAASSRTDSVGPAPDHEEKRYTGYVFYPEYGTYQESVPFQIFIKYRESEASIGRGPDVCRKPQQAYMPYEIQYDDPEQTTAFLAVPLLNQRDGLPHEYFIPRTRFEFIETEGRYTFHGECANPRTPAQRTVFTRAV